VDLGISGIQILVNSLYWPFIKVEYDVGISGQILKDQKKDYGDRIKALSAFTWRKWFGYIQSTSCIFGFIGHARRNYSVRVRDLGQILSQDYVQGHVLKHDYVRGPTSRIHWHGHVHRHFHRHGHVHGCRHVLSHIHGHGRWHGYVSSYVPILCVSHSKIHWHGHVRGHGRWQVHVFGHVPILCESRTRDDNQKCG
jgi:hypothetical protein